MSKKTVKTTTIKFTKSPTGAYHLAYNMGDVVDLPTELADILIADGFAETCEEPSAQDG